MRKIFSVLVLVLASIVGYAQQAETLTAVAGSCNVLSVSAPGVGEPGDFYVTALFNDISGQWIDSSVVAGYILWDVDGNRFNIDSVDYGGIIDLWVTDLDTAGTVATGIGAIVQENDNYPFWVAGISQGLNQIINAHMVQMIGNDIASGGGGGTDNQTFAEVLLEGNSAGASDIDMNDNSVNNMDSYSINTTSDDWLIFANGPNLQWSQTGAGARLSLRGATGTDLSRLGVGGLALPDWELDVKGVANADTFRVDGAYYFSTDPVVTSPGDTLVQVWTDSTTAFFIDKSEFGGSGSNQTLAQVLDEGNIANQNINLAQNSLMNVDTVRMDGSLGYFDISANGGPTLSARLSTSGDDFYRLKSNSDEVTFPLGKVGIGNFSSQSIAGSFHIYDTTTATIRLSDVASNDTTARSYIEMYRGFADSKLGEIGFSDNTSVDLSIENHITSGGVSFYTDAVEKSKLFPDGQWRFNYYGDTLFTGTAVKYLAIDDDGYVIEVDGSSGSSAPAVSSVTDTIDFNSNSEGIFTLDCSTGTSFDLVFQNGYNGGTYKLWFKSASNDTINLSSSITPAEETISYKIVDTSCVVDFFHDGSNYVFYDTLATITEFSPSNIAGLSLWLKADAGVLDDGGAAAINNDSVGTWQDQSGNGFHVSQDTSGYYPVYKTGIVNGQPVIRFTSTSDTVLSHLSRPSPLTALDAADFTIFVVFANTNDEENGTLISTKDSADGTENRVAMLADSRSANKVNTLIKASGTAYIATNDSDQGTSFRLSAAKLDGATLTAYHNGTAQADTETISGTWTNEFFRIGAQYYNSLAGNVYSVPLSGDIAEIIIYDSALSDPDRQSVESYLNSKYNIY
jgi:hypothetical protein